LDFFATIIKAAAVGIQHNPDYNGASQEGIAMSQATIAGIQSATEHYFPLTDNEKALLLKPYLAGWHPQ
jgi:hypothetical protein